MKYVLDTNVVKRIGSANRNANVDKWMATVNDSDLYLTLMTLQEVQKGIELLKRKSDPAKVLAARQIEQDFDKILSVFNDRILPLDALAAREWGRRLARHGTKEANDLAIIAIIAMHGDAIAVTQNISDFRHRGITVINPYDNPPSLFIDPET
ncbi:PIN domain-containing protein [Massilia rubra]|uniref:Type II toxin-antitoxin system VapC family toxin n=1 Tax=Massilia rubra TaxID=2607910 RepID=A0ABX0M5R0_9BURK|nr:type II toxin-antitoxin system VapC family toxin [Massilia rubra]